MSDVAVTNREVEKSTAATLSCTVTGLTEAARLTWKSSAGGSDIDSDNTAARDSGFVSSTNSQEFTLTVATSVTTADATYYCAVTSTEWSKSDEENAVVLNVFGVYFSFFNKYYFYEYVLCICFAETDQTNYIGSKTTCMGNLKLHIIFVFGYLH